MFDRLFEPVTINGMVVPNRVVFEPMGNYYAELDGNASARDAAFYARRGQGGCGLVLTEICSVMDGAGPWWDPPASFLRTTTGRTRCALAGRTRSAPASAACAASRASWPRTRTPTRPWSAP